MLRVHRILIHHKIQLINGYSMAIHQNLIGLCKVNDIGVVPGVVSAVVSGVVSGVASFSISGVVRSALKF